MRRSVCRRNERNGALGLLRMYAAAHSGAHTENGLMSIWPADGSSFAMVQSNRKSAAWVSKDADEVSAGLSDAIHRLEVRPISFGSDIDVKFNFVECKNIGVWKGVNGTSLSVRTIDEPQLFAFHMPICGGGEFARGSTKFSANQTTGLINKPQESDVFSYTADYDHLGVAIGIADLEKRTSEILEQPLRKPLEFNMNFSMQSASAEMLKSLAQTLLNSAHGPTKTDQCPLTSDFLSETILTLLIEGFSHTYSDAIAKVEAKSINEISPKYVKRAILYMRSEAHRPLSISDISRASSISVRSLQYGFKRFTGMSPLEYLQRVRLDRAIEELATTPETMTIRKIAQKWGFSNPSRFAELCIARLGDRPEQLRRDRNLTIQKLTRR